MTESERMEGARLIEEKIREVFSSAGKSVDEIQWNLARGGEILDYSSHTIHVTVEGNELKLESIPREVIEDYPGMGGNEALHASIKKLANQ